MFYKDILEQAEQGSAFLEYLEAQILKIYPLDPNHGDTFGGSMCVPVCPKNLWIHHCCCKRVLEAAILAYANKSQSLPRNLAPGAFGELPSVLNKCKFIHPLLNDPEVLSSASEKAKLFAKIFSKNSHLDDSGISLPVSYVPTLPV